MCSTWRPTAPRRLLLPVRRVVRRTAGDGKRGRGKCMTLVGSNTQYGIEPISQKQYLITFLTDHRRHICTIAMTSRGTLVFMSAHTPPPFTRSRQTSTYEVLVPRPLLPHFYRFRSIVSFDLFVFLSPHPPTDSKQ